jgi:hypothetical protein
MQEREDRRAALSAWVAVEMQRDEKRRPEPFRLEEIVGWLGHGFQQEDRQEAGPADDEPDVQAMQAKALAFVQLFGEQKAQANGQPPEE